jgi:hypothetical protein
MIRIAISAVLLLIGAPAHARNAHEKHGLPPGLVATTEWCLRETRLHPRSEKATMCRNIFADVYGTTTPDQE